ncbi:MAG: hypothetical protein MZV64_23625 [Ignavibacteriales bacterium]|nr:hypothetical protein [Ignavibacteriales bacterium]
MLVTGACGEIGQALVQGLATQGGYQDRHRATWLRCPTASRHCRRNTSQGDLVYQDQDIL